MFFLQNMGSYEVQNGFSTCGELSSFTKTPFVFQGVSRSMEPQSWTMSTEISQVTCDKLIFGIKYKSWLQIKFLFHIPVKL